LIKSLVGRIAGKGVAPQDHSPANSGHGTPPRHEPSHKASPGAQHDGDAGNDKGNKRRRRGGKAKPDVTPWSLDEFQVDPLEGQTRFHDLGLREELMHAIADLGFKYCSPIQASILPHTLQGNDAIGKAQTGTGKTAAFLVTIFNDLLCNPIEGERFVGEPRALVIAPTRELVMQIAQDAEDLARHTDLQVSTLIGGMDYQKQLNRLHNTVIDLVVATPGRLLDFMSRRDLYLDHVATDSVDQKVFLVSSEQRYRVLNNLLRSEEATSVIVFANRRDQVRRLHERLRKSGVAAGILSGEIPQAKRTSTLEQFKQGKIKVLVATDVAGRGIHVEGVSHVVNYNLPEDPEDYVHRIGRTGRAGATGISISFASEDDAFLLPDLEALLGTRLECTHPPAEWLV